MSDAESVAFIASAERLDLVKALNDLAEGSTAPQEWLDFATTRALGVSNLPTLLYVEGNHVRWFSGTGTAIQGLNGTLEALPAQSEEAN